MVEGFLSVIGFLAILASLLFLFIKVIERLERRQLRWFNRLTPAQQQTYRSILFVSFAVLFVAGIIYRCTTGGLAGRQEVHESRFDRCVSKVYSYSWYDKSSAVKFCSVADNYGLIWTPIGHGLGSFGVQGVGGKGNLDAVVGGERVRCYGKEMTRARIDRFAAQGYCWQRN